MFVRTQNRLQNTLHSLAVHPMHRGGLGGGKNLYRRLKKFTNTLQSLRGHKPAKEVHGLLHNSHRGLQELCAPSAGSRASTSCTALHTAPFLKLLALCLKMLIPKALGVSMVPIIRPPMTPAAPTPIIIPVRTEMFPSIPRYEL